MDDFICPFCERKGIRIVERSSDKQRLQCVNCQKRFYSHYSIKSKKRVGSRNQEKLTDFICPFCESREINRSGYRDEKQRFRCGSCNKHILSQCSIKTGWRKDQTIKPFSFEDDIWSLRVLFPLMDEAERCKILNFTYIKLDWFKLLVKRYIKQEIHTGSTPSVVHFRLGVLSLFSIYLGERQDIHSIDDISRSATLGFIYKHSKNKKTNTITNFLSALRHFFVTGNLHGWFKVSDHLIQKNDYPKHKPRIPNDIPSEVLMQIENNLHKLPDPVARMWMVGFFCAMRLSEIQLCKLDCLRQDNRGNWFITFWRKKNKDHHTLPISREGAQIIQQQQEYIKQKFGNSFSYLFCDYLGVSVTDVKQFNLIPAKKVAKPDLLSTCINCLIKSEDIRDENSRLWHFTNHQLRHTRLTYLFEAGHEFTVVSKWAGHKGWKVTQKYVHVKDHTMREETTNIQVSLVNIRGKSIAQEDLPKTLQDNPNSHTLAIPEDHINTPIYGYCGLSLDQDCPHWKACYTCPSFIARRELLPDYIRIRDQIREKQLRAEQNGESVKVDQFKQQADSLDNVIARFEGAA